MYEKDIKFKPKLVSLFSGQHNEPWYVKLNPDGYHIPVLQVEDKTVVEPSDIVDFISQLAEGAGTRGIQLRNKFHFSEGRGSMSAMGHMQSK